MIALRTEGLGKAYRVYRRPFDSLKELFLNRAYAETFWALRDVNLEVPKGSSLGIIGDNGAGKSTLLRLLAGSIAPSTGRVERVGRVGAILSLGAGFHPDLTGAANIQIGCALLGLSPAEAAKLLPEIVEFSELGSFIDRPVWTYSSGMSLRLGFSVATAVHPDILVLDEHLSVGDRHFQHKCIRRIMALRAAGCTLVFCSHNLHAVREVCDRSLWLRDGQPAMLGPAPSVLDAYQDHVRARDAGTPGVIQEEKATLERRRQLTDNFLREVVLGGDLRDDQIETGGRLELRVVAQLTETAWRDGVYLAVLIVRNDAVWCFGAKTKIDGLASGLYPISGDRYGATLVIDKLPLLAGQYSFTVALMDDLSPHTYDHLTSVAAFSVRHDGQSIGVMSIPHRWERP